MRKPSEEDVRNAQAEKAIFDNKVKRILFFLTLMTAIVGLWDKFGCHANKSQPTTQSQQTADSFSKQVKSQSRKEPPSVSSSKRHHPNTGASQTAEVKSQPVIPPAAKKEETTPLITTPKKSGPLQTANSDNIEFRLQSAEGSNRAQTIKMTVVLTSSAANWYIWSDVHSIIDGEGNEYKLKSFTNGASTYTHIALNTDVPIKLTYTFGGILPNVKNIKLFKFEYQHKSLDDPISVEFRDIPIEWK